MTLITGRWIAQAFGTLALPLILMLGIGAPAQAAPDYVFSPEEQEVMPLKTVFDPNLHKDALGPGTCSIAGFAYDRQKSGFLERKKPKQYLPEGTEIYLFPWTPYTKEAVQLFQKYEPVAEEYPMEVLMAEAQLRLLTGEDMPQFLPKVRVEADPRFPRIRKGTVVGKEGKFVFEGIKPGVYYLESSPAWTTRHYVFDVKVGEQVEEVYWSNGAVTTNTASLWASDSETTYRKVVLAKIVEVKQDGQAVEMELSQPFRDIKVR